MPTTLHVRCSCRNPKDYSIAREICGQNKLTEGEIMSVIGREQYTRSNGSLTDAH